MKSFRKYIYPIGILCFGLLLTSCREASFDGSRTGNDSQFLMEYSVFNSSDAQELELEKEDVIDVEVVSDAGEVSITIQKEDEEPVYEGHDVPTGAFQVKVKDGGTYTVTVTGEHAEGSVSFVKQNGSN